MTENGRVRFHALALAGVAALALLPAAGQAQTTEGTPPSDEDVILKAKAESEIVVTGTLIRGIAPAGANVLSTTSEDIQASGASSVAQLLQTIPQLGSFNSLQQPLGNSSEVTVNRPNLRSLPGFNSASGSTTLVLMDGHRLVGMGVTSTTPDPDVIPAGVIERLEIVPDGGSAVYGSDAVAGVMNFITLKRFDGIKADGSYSFADDYWSWDANVTAGKDWGSGSLFVSYAYLKSDEILGKDRDYIRQYPNASTGYTELRCEPGNIEALAGAYAPAGSVFGVNGGAVNQCDASDYATVYPRSERHSVFAGLTQQLSDKLSVEVRGYYTNRKTYVQNGPFRASEIIVPSFFAGTAAALGIPAITSPYSPFTFGGIVNGAPVFVPGNANARDLIQQVDFQFGPDDAQHTDLALDTWGLSSTFAYDLDGNFRLRLLGNYGQSTASRIATGFNEQALQNAIRAGLFNPYDVASSNPDAVDIISNFEEYGRTRQRFTNFRAIVDGDLFQMPAGAAKIAVGLEYFREDFNSARGQAIPGFEFSGADAQYVGATLVAPAQPGVFRFDVGRNVKSAFGELVVPVLDEGDGVGLTVSAAGRYDDYSDVGDTFNPRLGATLKPVDWISVHGAWGKSFNAPGLGDKEGADNDTLYILSGSAASFYAPPAALQAANGGPYPNYDGGLVVAMRGNAPGIKPQKATTMTLGIDVEPPVLPGLRLSATYYNIAYKNFIGLAPFENPALLYRDFSNLITIAPSQALLDEALANADIIAQGSPPISAARTYAFLDARKRNLGNFKLDGIDFALNYRTATAFGSIFLSANGTYELHRKRSNVPGGDYIDVLSKNTSRLRARTIAGAEVGPVLGQIAWNFTEGYDLDPAVGFEPQEHFNSFNTFDLFFKLDVPGGGIAQDLALTVNVNNVFDQDPPVYRGPSSISGAMGIDPLVANTVGRLVKIGISKQF
ncbi:MAG TPA: TonB-dependent receptor [Novosphingobium sp.]|nr:TonB-dependent receptor [Novosphingobium sp.]